LGKITLTKQHIHCFVDESRQDTLGKFFLVVAVIVEQSAYQHTEETLLHSETTTHKRRLTDHGTTN
jgi:hypothetical protein